MLTGIVTNNPTNNAKAPAILIKNKIILRPQSLLYCFPQSAHDRRLGNL